MSTDVANAICNEITGAGPGLSLTYGTNLFRGARRSPNATAGIPVNAVFVDVLPGSSPQQVMGQRSDIQASVVNMQIRWGNYHDGDAKARAIKDYLQGRTPTGFSYMLCLQSQAHHLGEIEQGQQFWSLNYLLVEIVAATS